jgi:hypothetical protein
MDGITDLVASLAAGTSSALSAEEIDRLEQLLRERPEFFGAYRNAIATRLCLLRHSPPVACPRATVEEIRSALYHMLKSLCLLQRSGRRATMA